MNINEIKLPPFNKISHKKDYTFFAMEVFVLHEKKEAKENINACIIFEACCRRGSARFNNSIKCTGYTIHFGIVVDGDRLQKYAKGSNHLYSQSYYRWYLGNIISESHDSSSIQSVIENLEKDLGIVLDSNVLKQTEEKFQELKTHVIGN
jgi:hypothetical protein